MNTLDTSHHFFRYAKAKLRYLLITPLLLLSFNVYSTYTVIGCVSDDTGYLYTGPSGVNSPRGSWYGPAYETSPVVTSGQIGSTIYCSPAALGNCVIRTRSRCTECTGPYDYKIGGGTDYYYEQSGQLTGYMTCPLDDYIGFLMLIVGGISFYYLRRNKVVLTTN
ncbi:hypothetical protein [Pedobacter boryungensis]|uniref:Secreted protein with PEP-CTERM sorting signal n=2 Tax=Pedobacter boryungensis TaxID=869962 RepID=A0ABX2D9A7_9SPHI|nr:hypothetical protein [Pedobacter boryungensis]NQX30625.1 hypothetical protein [Pedobacter boryungensis]